MVILEQQRDVALKISSVKVGLLMPEGKGPPGHFFQQVTPLSTPTTIDQSHFSLLYGKLLQENGGILCSGLLTQFILM